MELKSKSFLFQSDVGGIQLPSLHIGLKFGTEHFFSADDSGYNEVNHASDTIATEGEVMMYLPLAAGDQYSVCENLGDGFARLLDAANSEGRNDPFYLLHVLGKVEDGVVVAVMLTFWFYV